MGVASPASGPESTMGPTTAAGSKRTQPGRIWSYARWTAGKFHEARKLWAQELICPSRRHIRHSNMINHLLLHQNRMALQRQSSNNRTKIGPNSRSILPATHHSNMEDIQYRAVLSISNHTFKPPRPLLQRHLEAHTFRQHKEGDLALYMVQIKRARSRTRLSMPRRKPLLS